MSSVHKQMERVRMKQLKGYSSSELAGEDQVGDSASLRNVFISKDDAPKIDEAPKVESDPLSFLKKAVSDPNVVYAPEDETIVKPMEVETKTDDGKLGVEETKNEEEPRVEEVPEVEEVPRVLKDNLPSLMYSDFIGRESADVNWSDIMHMFPNANNFSVPNEVTTTHPPSRYILRFTLASGESVPFQHEDCLAYTYLFSRLSHMVEIFLIGDKKHKPLVERVTHIHDYGDLAERCCEYFTRLGMLETSGGKVIPHQDRVGMIKVHEKPSLTAKRLIAMFEALPDVDESIDWKAPKLKQADKISVSLSDSESNTEEGEIKEDPVKPAKPVSAVNPSADLSTPLLKLEHTEKVGCKKSSRRRYEGPMRRMKPMFDCIACTHNIEEKKYAELAVRHYMVAVQRSRCD